MIIKLYILSPDGKYIEYDYPEDCYDIAKEDMEGLTKEGVYCFLFASISELANHVHEELLLERPCLC